MMCVVARCDKWRTHNRNKSTKDSCKVINKQFRPIFNAILTDYVVNDAVNIVPGEHLPSEGKLDCEETFWLKLYTLPPEFHLKTNSNIFTK